MGHSHKPQPTLATPTAEPISLNQARRRRRRVVKPTSPLAIRSAPDSAADRLAERVSLQERTELVGHLDPYHAHRTGYGQGSWDVLSALEILLDADVDLETALAELRAWLMGDDFWQWMNAPDDPQEIIIGRWLARRQSAPPTTPPAS